LQLRCILDSVYERRFLDRMLPSLAPICLRPSTFFPRCQLFLGYSSYDSLPGLTGLCPKLIVLVSLQADGDDDDDDLPTALRFCP